MSVELEVQGHKLNGRGDVEATIALLKDGRVAYQDKVNLSRAQARSKFAKAVESHVEDDADIEGKLLELLEQLQGLAPEEHTCRYTACFPGLIDIVDVAGEPQFLILEGGGLAVCKERQGQLPPPGDLLPFLLPRADRVIAYYEEGEDTSLFDDLMAYHVNLSQLPSDGHAVLLAAWTGHSFLMERWSYSPILCLFAVPERGKSRTGRGIIYASYRGIATETVREANLFRWSNDLQATLFLDVKDLWRKAEKLGAEDILLQRFEPGGKVGRVLWPERGAFRDTRYYDVFGPTVIATNVMVDKILDSRSLTVIMPDADKDFPEPVTRENGLALKERLTAFRARYLNAELPTPPRLAQARLGDIVQPLSTIIQIMAPQHFDCFRALIQDIEADRLQEKAASFEGRLLEAMLDLADTQVVVGGNLPTAAITSKVNEGWSEKFQKSSVSVGLKLRALGFNRARMPDEVRARGWEYDTARVRRLAERYGLDVPPEEIPQEPLGEVSQVSQVSPPDMNQAGDTSPPSPNLSPNLSPSPRYENDTGDRCDGSSTPRGTKNLEEEKAEALALLRERDFPPLVVARNPETDRPYKSVAGGEKAWEGFMARAGPDDLEQLWGVLAEETEPTHE